MKLNTDLRLRVCLTHHELPWIDSPASGIRRRMLERDGNALVYVASGCVRAPEGEEDLCVLLLEDRAKLMQWWADHLDARRQGATVIPIGRKVSA